MTTDAIKKRKPRTEEQKAISALAYQTKAKAKCEFRACNSSNLDKFALEFLQPLLRSYMTAKHSGIPTSNANNMIKYREHKGSIFLELSIVELKAKYGTKSCDAFRKVFKMIQRGGRSLTTKESWSTIWVMNEDAFSLLREMNNTFNKKGELTSADVWDLIKDLTSFTRAATQHHIVESKSGRQQVQGILDSKQLLPTNAFGVVNSKRKELLAVTKKHNTTFDQKVKETKQVVSINIIKEAKKRNLQTNTYTTN